MATNAQIAANRRNAQSSTGPRTEEGKANTAQNAATTGLFTTRDFVRPDELEIYARITTVLWDELQPNGAMDVTLINEIISATWRLHRCATLEATLAQRAITAAADGTPILDPMEDPATTRTQNSIDRARAQAYRLLRAATAQLRQLHQQRLADLRQKSAAQAAGVAKKLASVMDFQNTIPTQSPIAVPAPTPRSAPCPCGSGEKYKRCCGHNAPAVLGDVA